MEHVFADRSKRWDAKDVLIGFILAASHATSRGTERRGKKGP